MYSIHNVNIFYMFVKQEIHIKKFHIVKQIYVNQSIKYYL